MFTVNDEKKVLNSISEEFENELKRNRISKTQFLNEFFLKEIIPDDVIPADAEDRLKNHRDRSKNSFKRNCEVAALYLSYLKRNYSTPEGMSLIDREAAWELYIEFQTRIATVPLKHGIEKAALDSLHNLFIAWRDMTKRYGPDAIYFLKHSQNHMNSEMRAFTEKWHALIEDTSLHLQFRDELKELQAKNVKYCERLEKDFRFGVNANITVDAED